MEEGLDIFGNVLDVDLSSGNTEFQYEFEHSESHVGSVLDMDLSESHVIEDPLIKHFEGNHHIMTHDMTLKRVRFTLQVKSVIAWLFGHRPRKTAALHKPKRRIKKREP